MTCSSTEKPYVIFSSPNHYLVHPFIRRSNSPYARMRPATSSSRTSRRSLSIRFKISIKSLGESLDHHYLALSYPPSSRANKQRSVSSTNLNSVSSRSHAILTIHVTVVDSDQNLSPYSTFDRFNVYSLTTLCSSIG